MRVSKYIHSCLVVEEGGEKILFDPGLFSFNEGRVNPEIFKDVSTIIITHAHPDHLDVQAVKKIAEQSGATIITNGDGRDALAKENLQATVLEDGSHQTKNYTIRAIPAKHESILAPTLPQNTAYVLNDSFLNPGDSFSDTFTSLKGIKALALAVMAPWNTELAVAHFARSVEPQMVIPVHDGYAKDFFIKQRYQNYTQYFSDKGITFQSMMEPGNTVEIK